MTQLIKRACDDHPWDFIIPLDGDEFLRVPDRATLEAALADLDPASIGLSEVVNYIPTASDDPDELDVLRRIVHRAKTRPDTGSKIFKVVIPGAVIRQPGFSLNEGHHGVCIDGKPVRNAGSTGSALLTSPSAPSISSSCAPSCAASPGLRARITIRAGAGITARSSSSSRVKPAISAADLTAAALLYVDIYIEPGETPHQKVLVREPVSPAYDRLRFTNPDDMAVLPPILDMMDFVVDELRAARMMSPGHAAPVALAAQTSVSAVGTPVEKRAVTNASPSARHTFQSFWHGGVLSPYQLFCLKSFIDCGHAVDLYTYDLNLVAPAGVRGSRRRRTCRSR